MPETKKKPEPEKKGKCYQCAKPCGDDQYCHGCKEFICEECTVNFDPPWGSHQPNVHFEESEDDD